MESRDAPRAGVGLRDHIEFVAPAAGDAINDELPSSGDEIPLPPWDDLMEMDPVDLDHQLRAGFIARAVPQPKTRE